MIKVEERYGKSFWTRRGVRQGCPFSSILFNILIADIEKELERDRIERLKLGETKVTQMRMI